MRFSRSNGRELSLLSVPKVSGVLGTSDKQSKFCFVFFFKKKNKEIVPNMLLDDKYRNLL